MSADDTGALAEVEWREIVAEVEEPINYGILRGQIERIIAARVEQARAGEGALRERVEALADAWETAHGEPPVDPSHISVRHAHDLRAALTEGQP